MSQPRLPIALEGWPFILAPALLAEILALAGVLWAALLAFGLACFVTYFFRDPERVIPEGGSLVVSPADGRIVFLGQVEAAALSGRPALKVSVFMSLLDVHVNRSPVSGRVEGIKYIPGAFFNASLDKASARNERLALALTTDGGHQVETVQVAGLVARRIVCWTERGDRLEAGQRFGLIRFGSRLDVYLPVESRLEVKPGQRVKAGQSLLGRLPS